MDTAVQEDNKYDDIDKTVWNFKIYALLEVVKDFTKCKIIKEFENVKQ